MRIAIVQSRPAFGDPDSNLEGLLGAVASVNADFYVLPELCLAGYDFEDRPEAARFAERPDSPRLDSLARAATDRGAGISFGFAEAAEGGRLFNSALLSLPDGRRRVYRKTHLFAREKLLFEPGDTGFFVEEFRGLRVGMAICFDWIFPESFRTLALLGADLIAHNANLVLPWCQRADFARAVENRVYVATANRVGREERGGRSLSFTGGSVLVAPDGSSLLELPVDEPAVRVAEIDPLRARDKRLNAWNDLLADRRPEFYAARRSPEPTEDTGA
ncbi:MAG: acyltransferase [Spirochaetaceae bacterium]|nr:acyltransferase [Spirochaetaceae bacterium]